MAIAGTNIPLNTAEGEDKITITEKVTTPYFSTGATTLAASRIISESFSAGNSNNTYYFGISDSGTATVTEFHVAYGNSNGYGGDNVDGTVKSPTEVIYKQFANLLLPANEVTGGFFISRNNSLSSAPSSAAVGAGKDTEIYVLSAERSNMKDRLNKKNWTIVLSGSLGSGLVAGAGSPLTRLSLTDDSANDSPTATPVGDRYNIVSGSDGTIQSEASVRTFGFYYPDQGLMVFSGQELSASIPGRSGSRNADSPAVFNSGSQMGFHTTTNVDKNYNNGLRFINTLQPNGASMKFRDEEDQVSAQYFCRAKAGHFNFSNNPTFVSGSQNELRHTTMKGNPTTFISSVQLYNAGGDLVAIGNLSTPLKKNFSSEATIKVKLTY